MSTRSFILAMAAFATVGSAALAPSSASAMPMGIIIKPKPVMGVVINPPHPVLGIVIKPKPILGVVINPPHPIMGVAINPDPDHDHDGPRFWWHHRHGPEFIVGSDPVRVSSPVVSAPAPVTTAVPSAPCNCLTKQYLQDGSVLFSDICTKEAAVATPDQLRAQLQGSGPQVH